MDTGPSVECATGAGSMGTLDLLNIKASHFPGHIIKAILIFTRNRIEDIFLTYAQFSIPCLVSVIISRQATIIKVSTRTVAGSVLLKKGINHKQMQNLWL